MSVIKYIFFSTILILWIIFLNQTFPSDNENSNVYTIIIFFLLIIWVIIGIFLLLSKTNPPIYVYMLLTIVGCLTAYNFYPWNKGYGGIQIIKDCYKKKDSIIAADIAWIYSLPQRVENLPLIALSQARFNNEIKPEKCYLFQCYYYDTSQTQKYVSKYMIYIKNGLPYTTKSSSSFVRYNNYQFQLEETVDNKFSVILDYAKDSVRLISNNKDILVNINRETESYFYSNTRYRCELKRIDSYNGFNVKKAYWIYRIL